MPLSRKNYVKNVAYGTRTVMPVGSVSVENNKFSCDEEILWMLLLKKKTDTPKKLQNVAETAHFILPYFLLLETKKRSLADILVVKAECFETRFSKKEWLNALHCKVYSIYDTNK